MSRPFLRARPSHWGALAITSVVAVLTACPALAQDADAELLPAMGTQLPAGRYVSDVVGPTIDFRVSEGWTVGPSGDGPIFTLLRTDEPGTVLSITRFDGDVFLDSCDPSSLSTVEATVPRLVDVIGGNPYLNPGAPTQISVDGYDGLALDVATPAYTECALPQLLIWALPMPDGEFMQVADQQSRFIVLDVDGDVIVVAIETFPGVPFGGLLDASMDLVDSMRIEPGEYVPPSPSASPSPASLPSPSASPSQAA